MERRTRQAAQTPRKKNRKRNKSVPEPEIIPHNIKNDTPPIGVPISDDDSSDDYYFAESPHAESQGDVYDDVAPAAPPTTLAPVAPNIAPDGATVPPNPSPEGAISYPEGDNTCNHVWTRDKDNRLKRSKLNI